MDKSQQTVAFALGFPVYFIGLWCVICLLISRMSGWRRLAQQFVAANPPTGQCFRCQYGRIGWASYNGCLTIFTSEDGLYLAVWPIFRLGHPPLFMPWSEIHNREDAGWFLFKQTKFEVGSPCLVKIRLPRKVFENQSTAV